jgi:hypothetical protein
MNRILLIPLLLAMIAISSCTFQHGTSKDYVYGYDKGIIWHHLYLKDDHKTCYCFDNPNFIATLKTAQEMNEKVIVTYETYLLRGMLCTSAEGYENVIVTDVKLMGENQ